MWPVESSSRLLPYYALSRFRPYLVNVTGSIACRIYTQFSLCSSGMVVSDYKHVGLSEYIYIVHYIGLKVAPPHCTKGMMKTSVHTTTKAMNYLSADE